MEKYTNDAKVRRSEEVTIARTDEALARLGLGNAGKIYPKSDTQGYEREIIKGLGEALGMITAMQLELPLKPLYRDQLGFMEMCEWMEDQGLILRDVFVANHNLNSGEVIEVEGIFVEKP